MYMRWLRASVEKYRKGPKILFLRPPEHLGYDVLLKFILFGDQGVGMSSLMMRYTDNTFDDVNHLDFFKIKQLRLNNVRIKLQVWDRDKRIRFKFVAGSYFRGAHGIILGYDVSEPRSFENLRPWLKEIESFTTEKITTILVATKIDLPRLVTKEMEQQLTDELGLVCVETSAKENTNVDEAFLALVKQLGFGFGDDSFGGTPCYIPSDQTLAARGIVWDSQRKDKNATTK